MRLGALILIVIGITAAYGAEWNEIPALPEKLGFAGAFAGVSHGALVVAGGTHFPDRMPWDGGVKKWFDDVYVIETASGPWKKVGKLPKAAGYGVSINTEAGFVMIGGGSANEHFRDVWQLSWTEGKLVTSLLPSLPRPCAFMSGVRAGSIIHIFGGIDQPDATSAAASHWTLDLSDPASGWMVREDLPAEGRILSVSGCDDEGLVYVFSGASLRPGADGKPVRSWLKDAWRYAEESGWQRLPDLPRAAVAAPSPTPLIDGQFWILGGDDGSLVDFQPKHKHPGFPRTVLGYGIQAHVWKEIGEVPFSLVTSPTVEWQGRIVIPGGEARPGVRSPQVWARSMQ